MNFSNKFKIWWWVILLFTLTLVSAWRLYINAFDSADIFIFIFWFILVLFPIISEISIFGITVKKDIENAKNELKSYIAQIHNTNQTNININTSLADKKEYKEKIKQETEEAEIEDLEEGPKDFSVIENIEDKKVQNFKKHKERLEKLIMIEKLVTEFLKKQYNEDYKTQIKFEDRITQKTMITDGVIYKNGQIIKAVEIKYITEKSFDPFHLIISGFIQKWAKFGLKIPLLFVVVSDSLDVNSSKSINYKILSLNNNKRLNPDSILVSAIFFKLNNSELQQLKFG